MRKFYIIYCFLSILSQLHGQNVFNDNFEQGLKYWRSVPADATSVKIEKMDDGRRLLVISPKDVNLELNSCALKIDKDFNTAESYNITYEINVTAINTGTFNISLVFNDVKDKPLKQYSFSTLATGQKTDGWEKFTSKFGKNSEYPFPDGTASVMINLAFCDASGKSSGKIMIDNIGISRVMPLTPVLPEIKTTDAGQIPARFEDPADKDYYWLEAESFAPDDAIYGSLKYRNAWTKVKVGIPNESNMHSLVRPQAGNEAEAAAFIRISRSGYYNLWVRTGSLSQWGRQRITVEVNGQKFKAEPSPGDQLLNDAFTWVKLNPEPLKLRRTRPVVLKIIMMLIIFPVKKLQIVARYEIRRLGGKKIKKRAATQNLLPGIATDFEHSIVHPCDLGRFIDDADGEMGKFRYGTKPFFAFLQTVDEVLLSG